MDWQKTAYIGGILVLSFVLLFKWNEFQDKQEALNISQSEPSVTIPAEVPTSAPLANNSNVPQSEIPVAPAAANNDAPVIAAAPVVNSSQLISVSTDTLDIIIDRSGGDIVKAVLPQYKVKLGGEEGFTILDRTSDTTYIAQSGLVGTNGTDTAEGRPLFNATASSYSLEEGKDTLTVDLTLNEDGINITKRFTFNRNDYLVHVDYLIDNQSSNVWKGNLYGQIKRDSHRPPAAADSGFGVNPYLGAATTDDDEKYRKIPFDEFEELKEKEKKFSVQGGWIAMVQHYFVSAWVPNKDEKNNFEFIKVNNQDVHLLRYISPQTSINPGEQAEINSRFYVGPKDIDHLEAIAENLDLTIDFGFLWWIAKPLFHLLDFLHSYIGNWGWSIIALTIIIKAIFFYPSAVSYRSMAKMRKVSPKMAEIKERFGDDRQKMSQEMMKLYKKEKVNPMGGCLPILIQMPVFISLYWVLMESVEIRHAPFTLWIHDLSVIDPYFIFPLLMGATMFIQQQLNPTPPDPMQAKIMKWMPVGFTVMFLWFPAGLVIYWVTNNTLSIIQQYIITRQIEAS
ncbi:MAG: membrane protein insertase YidC [Cellvibrionaceae bacterium]